MPKNEFIVYKTTNTINGKYYIGKHKLGPKSNTYLGSGKNLHTDIKLYGKDCFVRDILFECDSEAECYEKEAELVTIDVVNDPLCYNIVTGGCGGKTQHSTTKQLIKEAVTNEWANNQGRIDASRQRMIELNKSGKAGPKSYTDKSRSILSKKSSSRWADDEYKKTTSQSISKGKTGIKQSPTHRLNNIEAQNKTIYCPHCNSYNKVASHGRWHGDKCKDKIQ